jgi:hypothetical protein
MKKRRFFAKKVFHKRMAIAIAAVCGERGPARAVRTAKRKYLLFARKGLIFG